MQVIVFEDKDPQYQDIIVKLSKTIAKIEDVIEDMRKYNNNMNNLNITFHNN